MSDGLMCVVFLGEGSIAPYRNGESIPMQGRLSIGVYFNLGADQKQHKLSMVNGQ